MSQVLPFRRPAATEEPSVLDVRRTAAPGEEIKGGGVTQARQPGPAPAQAGEPHASERRSGPAPQAAGDSGRGGSLRHLAVYMHDLSGGGVERMRLELIRVFLARGIAVTLVLHARTGALARQVPQGCRVVVLGGRRTAEDVPRLAWFLRRARPDVLMASLDHNNVAALLARRLAGGRTRLVICQHNALSAEAEHMHGWKYRAVPLLYRLLGGSADGIVAVSAGVADDLARTGAIARHRITVIHNPVISGDFMARSAATVDDPWLAADAAPVLVWAGRLVAQKDPHTLLRAFAGVAPPARLLLLGEGELRPELERLVQSLGLAGRVRFAGFQANPLPWIREAHALVLSSRYEGLGNVLVEALGCGTAVVSTDCPHGPREILEDGRHGALVPVGDAAALAAAMRAALAGGRDPAALRSRAAAFTAEHAVAQHLALFARLGCPLARSASGAP
jgi:glycosyltransferase involved in cell wall biosynthesis